MDLLVIYGYRFSLCISMAVALSHTCDQTVDLGLVPSLGRQSA
ncbi:hypothetical protein T01_14986 [Trichinella spiralis]|uniref:Uncharacterized protein n=1 Tax=Trichinella spiralis TaxID=6334 RepID=A0A0V0YVE2_TRISP|nr:hypothetical protein T01_14986 [Trichinella spiralis]